MSDTVDWKKKAEAEYQNEKESIRDEVRTGLYLHLIIYTVLGVVFGLVYVIRWMIVGDSFLPSNHDAIWAIGVFVGGIPCVYLMDRNDRISEIREQRLVRLELKIDALMNQQDASSARYEELQRDVQRTMSDTDLHIRGLL